MASGCGVSPTSTPDSLTELPEEVLRGVPFAIPEEGPTDEWREARRLFFAAYMLQLEGKLDVAIELYRRSISAFPTAEAYTFLGWTYSWMERYDDAIREAQQAIALNPDYGNPYNDIGVYLMAQGKPDEAIPWLNQAIQAKRYASPQFPWLNLGNIWVLKEEWGRALACYEEALKLAPDCAVTSVPAVQASLFLPPEGARNPGTAAEQQAVKQAIVQYFQAWNDYDADALRDCSDPLSTDISMGVLLYLAAAKHAGRKTTVHDSEALHLEGCTAIVETRVSISGGKAEIYWHLLQQTNETWKVVVRLSPFG